MKAFKTVKDGYLWAGNYSASELAQCFGYAPGRDIRDTAEGLPEGWKAEAACPGYHSVWLPLAEVDAHFTAQGLEKEWLQEGTTA